MAPHYCLYPPDPDIIGIGVRCTLYIQALGIGMRTYPSFTFTLFTPSRISCDKLLH